MKVCTSRLGAHRVVCLWAGMPKAGGILTMGCTRSGRFLRRAIDRSWPSHFTRVEAPEGQANHYRNVRVPSAPRSTLAITVGVHCFFALPLTLPGLLAA